MIGRKIELMIEDNKSDPKEAASAAEKLIVRDKVPVIMGAWGVDDAGRHAQARGVRRADGGRDFERGPITKRGNPWIFRISPPSEMEALGLEQYVESSASSRPTSSPSTPTGAAAPSSAFGDMLKKGAAVGAVEFMEQSATDMNAQITKIKAATATRCSSPPRVEQITLVLKQAQEQRLARKVVTTGGSSSPTQLIKQAGAAAEGTYHIVFFMPWFPEAMPDGKLAKAFVDEWAKRGHPFEGLTEGFRGHDGIATIVEAVKIAGKDEPKAIQEALWKVSFIGVNGPDQVREGRPGRQGERAEQAEHLRRPDQGRQGRAAGLRAKK